MPGIQGFQIQVLRCLKLIQWNNLNQITETCNWSQYYKNAHSKDMPTLKFSGKLDMI